VDKTRGIKEIYNGPGGAAWCNCQPATKNRQRPISLKVLTELNKHVSDVDRIKQVSDYPELN